LGNHPHHALGIELAQVFSIPGVMRNARDHPVTREKKGAFREKAPAPIRMPPAATSPQVLSLKLSSLTPW
jgi:hypothetical protein